MAARPPPYNFGQPRGSGPGNVRTAQVAPAPVVRGTAPATTLVAAPPPYSGRTRRVSRGKRSSKGANTATSCLKAYLEMYKHPFRSPTVCLPISPAPPSAKRTTWIKGTCSIGTGRFGYVWVNPNAANDQDMVYFTGNTYVGLGALLTAGTGITAVAGNGPYTASEFGAGAVQVRPAMVAARVRYIGTQLSMSGRVVSFVDPHHHIMSGQTPSNALAYMSVTPDVVDRKWKECRALPMMPAEFDYYDTPATWPACMAIWMTGEPGNEFEFEVVIHWEFIGTPTSAVSTNSETHPWATTAINALNGLGNVASKTGEYLPQLTKHAPALMKLLREEL